MTKFKKDGRNLGGSEEEVANISPFIDCSRRSVFRRQDGAGVFEYSCGC